MARNTKSSQHKDLAVRDDDNQACPGQGRLEAAEAAAAEARSAPAGNSGIDCRAMATVEVKGVEGMQALLAQRIGPSEWRTVTQEDIDTFADLSGDDQWIHVDVERAKTESPFGTTIAHGNLTLSLVDGFRKDLISSTGFALGVNYGWNKIRFPAPVPAGGRVRGSAEVVSVEEIGGGWWQVVTRFTLEVEGNEKPCFVGDSVTRVMAPAE